MSRMSFKPSLTVRGRRFKGLRGFEGKPAHPPLTDVPAGAYVLAPAFDLVSFIGQDQEWGRAFFLAATYTFVGGSLVSLLAALTGFMDWRNTEKGTQVRRTANAHAWTMITMTVLVLVTIALRLLVFEGEPSTPVGLLVLSGVIATLMLVGGTIGGGLTYEHGFNVETAGDSPAWHRSERDLLPAELADARARPAAADDSEPPATVRATSAWQVTSSSSTPTTRGAER